jgi:hypothetical protein
MGCDGCFIAMATAASSQWIDAARFGAFRSLWLDENARSGATKNHSLSAATIRLDAVSHRHV